MAEIKSIVEPDAVGDDVRRESMSRVGIHWLILPISTSLFGSTNKTVRMAWAMMKCDADYDEQRAAA